MNSKQSAVSNEKSAVRSQQSALVPIEIREAVQLSDAMAVMEVTVALMAPLLLLLSISPSSSSSSRGGQCSTEQMRSILGGGEAPCQPRPTIVTLQEQNGGLQVLAPSHVEVNRCSGSCPLAHFSCLPNTVKQVSVPVVLSPNTLTHGRTSAMCDTVQVEEHTSCLCGCPVSPKDCPSQDKHYFLPYECRCACKQEKGRGSCLSRGWTWDPSSCSCRCPGSPYPVCPSGYVFDYEKSCSCIPIHVMGFSELEVVLVVVVSSCLLSLISLAQCYRQGVGLFKNRRVGLTRDRHFKQALHSLNTRFDQSIRMKNGDIGDSVEESDLLARQVRGMSL